MRVRRTLVFLLGLVLFAGMNAFILQPARADGTAGSLNFLCQPIPEGTPPEGEEPLQTAGVQVFDGIDITFNGDAPVGVPVSVPDEDPLTPGTQFSIVKKNTSGGNFKVDFIDKNDIPGAKGPEVQFRPQPRVKAAQGFPDVGFLDLFVENYNLPADLAPNPFAPNDNLSVAGLDLIVFGTDTLANLPQGIRGEIEVGIRFRTSDNDWQNTRIKFAIDSRQAGDEFPQRLQSSLVFKRKYTQEGMGIPTTWAAYGQWAEFHSAPDDPDDLVVNQPGIQVGVDVDTVLDSGGTLTFDNMATVNTDWNATPRVFALGVADTCASWDPVNFPSETHIAWNHRGLPDPAASNLDVDLRFNRGEGLPITINDGGPVDTFADQTVFSAGLEGMPERLDAIFHPNTVGITRSTDVEPTITLDELQLASDDPDTTEDLPIHVEGQIEDLPRHTFVVADFDDEGSLAKVDASFWTLAGCDGEPPPADPPAPLDARRLDIDQVNPLFPAGCERHSFDSATSARMLIQNHLPQDLNADDAMAGLAEEPTDDQYLYYVNRANQDLSADNELYKMAFRLNGVERGIYDATDPPVDGTRLKIYGQRDIDPLADDAARVRVDVDGRTDFDDEVLNEGTRIEADVIIPDLPDDLRIDYVSDPAGTPFDATWRATDPIELKEGQIDLQLPGPTAINVHGVLETTAVGALPPAGQIVMTEATDGGTGDVTHRVDYAAPAAPTDDFPTPVVPAYDPNTITQIHLGALVSTKEWRDDGDELRVHALLDVPQNIFVEWVTDVDEQLVSVQGVLCPPDNPICEETIVDATGYFGPSTGVTGFDLFDRPDQPPFRRFRPLVVY